MKKELNNDEILEEWDWLSAKPTGKAVSRKLSHEQGIPHEGVHLWILRTSSDSPELLFQHRATFKESYPDCLDITVGGHVPFGLNENKIQKESSEEIGISPEDKNLIDLGYYKYEEKYENVFHREFQHVYLLNENMPLDKYKFNDGEVVGIYAVPINKLKKLLNEDISFTVEGYNGISIIKKHLSKKDFHPLLFDQIMEKYIEILFTGIEEFIIKGIVSVKMSF